MQIDCMYALTMRDRLRVVVDVDVDLEDDT
jgi:hypothetical protein